MRLAGAAALTLAAAAAAVLVLDRPVAQLALHRAAEAGAAAALLSAVSSPFIVLPVLAAIAALEQARHAIVRSVGLAPSGVHTAGRLLIGTAAATLVALLLKSVIGRARPTADAFQHLSFKPFGFDDAFGSFPSAQAAMAGALAAGLCLCFPRQKWLAIAAAAIIGLARVVSGAHWLSDSLIGGALGAMIGYMTFTAARKPQPEYYL